MAKPTVYRFCAGPWNFSEGQDPYGPTTRPAQTFDWKLSALKELGFEAMMFGRVEHMSWNNSAQGGSNICRGQRSTASI